MYITISGLYVGHSTNLIDQKSIEVPKVVMPTNKKILL